MSVTERSRNQRWYPDVGSASHNTQCAFWVNFEGSYRLQLFLRWNIKYSAHSEFVGLVDVEVMVVKPNKFNMNLDGVQSVSTRRVKEDVPAARRSPAH